MHSLNVRWRGLVAGLPRGVGRVLSSAKIGTSSWRYYTDGVACRASEYYAGAGEAPGRWHGRGLEQLGLTSGGLVSERELEALFARGLHPTAGTPLGRAWRTDGVTGFDLTFSAPRASARCGRWATARRRPRRWRRTGRRCGPAWPIWTGTRRCPGAGPTGGADRLGRAGGGGVRSSQQPGRRPAAAHPHALVLNKVRCSDGRWRTLDATELFHHKKSAGMIYQAALCNEMRCFAFERGLTL